MEQKDKIINFPKKILRFKTLFQNNIFDEVFLDEKDKALSPVVLSDEIPGEAIKKPNEKERRKTDLITNQEKYNKYGPNIIFIGPKLERNDNDDNIHEILNEQVFKILSNEKFCKNNLNRKK